MLTIVGVVSAVFLAACAAFTPGTPLVIIFLILLVGGFFRSLTFTSINTIAYAEVAARELSRATALMAVSQQLSISAGVAVGAAVVEATLRWKGATAISAERFLAGVSGGRSDFSVVGILLRAAAARCRRGNVRAQVRQGRGTDRGRRNLGSEARIGVLEPDVVQHVRLCVGFVASRANFPFGDRCASS